MPILRVEIYSAARYVLRKSCQLRAFSAASLFVANGRIFVKRGRRKRNQADKSCSPVYQATAPPDTKRYASAESTKSRPLSAKFNVLCTFLSALLEPKFSANRKKNLRCRLDCLCSFACYNFPTILDRSFDKRRN